MRETAQASILPIMLRRTTLSLTLTGAMLLTPSYATASADAGPMSEGRPQRIGGAVAMGLGAALMIPMGLGITEYDQAAAEIERFNTRAVAADRRFTSEEFSAVEDAYDRSHRMQALAISTGVAGGVLAVGGLALYLVGVRRTPDRAMAARQVRASPTFTAKLVGFSISARF